MAEITNPKQAGERLLQFAREGRLVQGVWHDEEDGREVACLLGAAAGIEEADQCPASLMPAWVAWALPGLWDGQTPAHAQTFARRWGEAMVRPEWTRIDWSTVHGEWLAFVLQQARAAATRAAQAAAIADAYAYDYAVRAAARDAQADALMNAIEKAMEVARG